MNSITLTDSFRIKGIPLEPKNGSTNSTVTSNEFGSSWSDMGDFDVPDSRSKNINRTRSPIGDGKLPARRHSKGDQVLPLQKMCTKKSFLFLTAFVTISILLSFFMDLIANNLSKDIVVGDGFLVVKGSTHEKIATKSFGTIAYAGLLMDDSGNTDNLRRLTASVAVDTCKIEDFDNMSVSQYYRSSLTKKACTELHSDAQSGARPAIIHQTDGSITTELGNLATFKTAQYHGGGCNFINAWIGETETWYFRSCGDDVCDWFVTPNEEIPLPCCFTHITDGKKKEEYTPCECDGQCQSGLSCAYRSDGLDDKKVCISITNNFYNPSPPNLKQKSFNHVGPMAEIGKDFYKEVEKSLKVINAVQETQVFDAQNYHSLRGKLKKMGDETHDTLFVKESGCLFNGKVRAGYIEEVCTPVRELRQSRDLHKTATLELGVVEKFGDVCYGGFRRTISLGNPLNLTTFYPKQEVAEFTNLMNSNLNLQTEYVLLDGQETCRVPSVFNRAFSVDNELWGPNADNDGMEHHLRSCAKKCVIPDGKNCTVVLGGHSEGGALAILAAIRIHDLNPVVINSGAPPAVYVGRNGICPFLNQDRIFRFVAAQGISSTRKGISPRNAILYDPIPHVTGRGIHMGNEFRVIDDSVTSVAYFYGPRHPSVYRNNYGAVSATHHYKNYYVTWLFDPISDHFDNNAATPIQLGWENGLRCSHNDECQSTRCAWNIQYPKLLPHSAWGLYSLGRFCKAKIEIGDQCLGSYECNTGRCAPNPDCGNCPWTCAKLAPNGELCIEDLDCKSQRCNLEGAERFCRPQLENEDQCNRIKDCLSGRCDHKKTWPFSQICKEKIQSGNMCNESSECDSNICRKSATNFTSSWKCL